MKTKTLFFVALGFAVLVVGGTSANAQVVDAVKDAASKTKDATISATKKTSVVVTDGVTTAAEKTKDATVDTSKKAAKSSKSFGNNAVNVTENVTENVAEKSREGGKWATVKTWNGTKWVSKRVWFATKKSASETKDFVAGEEKPKQ